MTSPSARSTEMLRDQGYLVGVVERWLPIPGSKVRVDLFGFIDLIAIHRETGLVMAVQATSREGGNMAARVKKIREHENLPIVLNAGWLIRIHGWAKMPKTEKRIRARWECRVLDHTGQELSDGSRQ